VVERALERVTKLAALSPQRRFGGGVQLGRVAAVERRGRIW
jgi:hypothetical protein